MTGRTRFLRTARRVALLAALALAVPAAVQVPASISLTTVQTARAVDFSDGVLWILVLGSDARPGQDVMTGRTDAIQLVGLNWRRDIAVSIGIPRDSWVELDLPDVSEGRINEALSESRSPDLVAEVVGRLVGITPDLVLVTGFEGFESMVGEIGTVVVDSPVAFPDNEHDLVVRRGPNRFDAGQALSYARIREGLDGGDLDRAANHQRLMLAVLAALRRQEDDEGFMEAATLAALGGLETDLGPIDLYRLAQAVTSINPARTTSCIIGGTPFTTAGGAQVLRPDTAQARALGDDARDDARLQGGCRAG